MFDSATFKSFKLPDVAYATSNSCLTAINNRKLLKIGGLMSDETTCHYIEVYDCEKNIWQTVDPAVERVQGDFSLLSSSASVQIN